MTRIVWTPAKDARIVEMRAQGRSASEIGIVVDATASAVSARADRLGLPHMPTGRKAGETATPRAPSVAATWTANADAALVEWHAAANGDWRKVAPKVGRTVEECRARFRQLMVLRPIRAEVERKCLYCLRVRKIREPMRICDGCKDTEEFQHAAATA